MKTLHYIFFSVIILFTVSAYSQTEHSGYFEGSLQFEVEFKGAQAEMLKENEPNNQLLMHLKDGDYIVQLSGGKYPKTFIFIADSNFEYSMDMVNKRAFRFSPHSDLNTEDKVEDPVAKPTGNTMEVNGVMCDEYKMKKDEILFTFYVNDAYRMNTDLYPADTRAKASFLAKGLDGRIPLKTIKQQKGLFVVTTIKKINPREFDTEQFRIPMGFEVKNRDYRY